MTNPVCDKCNSLFVEAPEGVMHQRTCTQAIPGDDADKMRSLCREVIIGTWTDQLLAIFPRSDMVGDPVVLGRDSTLDGTKHKNSIIVEWHFPGITFTLARGLGKYKGHELSVYAVQKMSFNALKKGKKRNVPKYK